MARIDELIEGAKTIAIAGHIHPDGDCIGSTMGLYLYLKKNRPDLSVDIYLETVQPVFSYIPRLDEVRSVPENAPQYDCFVLLDTSSLDRIGVASSCFTDAKARVCIDHHITNQGFAEKNVIEPEASSASEVLFDLLDREKIDKDIASALYTGLIHDSGVFQYSNTGVKTLTTAAYLISFGIDFPKIIDESFYERTYKQTRILGKTLDEAKLYLDGKVAAAVVRPEDLVNYEVGKQDLDSIVSQLRLIKGVDAAIFIYPADEGRYKVSLRSCNITDVSAVAAVYGGGGHVKAAGCTMNGTPDEIIEKLVKEIGKQLN